MRSLDSVVERQPRARRFGDIVEAAGVVARLTVAVVPAAVLPAAAVPVPITLAGERPIAIAIAIPIPTVLPSE